MTIIAAVTKASQYVGEGVTKDLKRWIILIILSIIQSVSLCLIPLLNGYVARVFHAPEPVPDTKNWFGLFIDGWKLNLIAILYAIPAIIILVFFGVLSFITFESALSLVQGSSDILLTSLLDVIGIFGIAIAGILFVLLTLIMFMAMVRAMRKQSVTEAFSISAIMTDISKKTGWLEYLVLWIVLWILTFIFAIICFGLSLIPLPPLGLILIIIILPAWAIFFARYIALIYDGQV